MSTSRTTVPSPDPNLASAPWHKSSYSGGANDCVEVADLGDRVAVRDSKDLGLRPLVFSRAAVRALVGRVADGEI